MVTGWAAWRLIHGDDGGDLVQPGDFQQGSVDRARGADLDGEPGSPGDPEQGPDGGAVAVGHCGHVGGDGAGGGGGLVEGGLEFPDVDQVDVARAAHGGGAAFADGQELEPCLRAAAWGAAARGIRIGMNGAGYAGVFGHGFSSLVKVTVVPCADGSIVTSSMSACMKMSPWPRVPGAGCSRSAAGDRQVPVSVTVSWTMVWAARAVRVIWTGGALAERPAVACSTPLAAASPATIR